MLLRAVGVVTAVVVVVVDDDDVLFVVVVVHQAKVAIEECAQLRTATVARDAEIAGKTSHLCDEPVRIVSFFDAAPCHASCVGSTESDHTPAR